MVRRQMQEALAQLGSNSTLVSRRQCSGVLDLAHAAARSRLVEQLEQLVSNYWCP
jgi:hypothetical protein